MPADLRSTPIIGVWELVGQSNSDHRGIFLNGFRAQDPAFAEAWGQRPILQVNLSRTEAVGTVRGLHLQAPPREAKLVRCLRGRVGRGGGFTVGFVDAGQMACCGVQSGSLQRAADPEGCAHGFQVLEAELLYLHSGSWVPQAETGVNCRDPQLAITWPLPPLGLSTGISFVGIDAFRQVSDK